MENSCNVKPNTNEILNKKNEKVITDEFAQLEEIFEKYFTTFKKNKNVLTNCNITKQQAKKGITKNIKVSIADICSNCKGSGKNIDFQTKQCERCCGRGYIYSEKTIAVKIPPKIRNNDLIVIESQGNKLYIDKERGDIFIRVHIYGNRSKRKGKIIYGKT